MSEDEVMYHVVPVNDLREHELKNDCWCIPIEEEGVMVHKSMDDRESYEEGRLLH